MKEAEEIQHTGKNGMYQIEWTKELELENTVDVQLPGISQSVSIISPRRLQGLLSSRFRMQFHPSWKKLRDELYDRTKTDYTNRELFQISHYETLIWNATGINLEMPLGGEPGMWEGEFDDLEGVSEHEEFWKQDEKKYDLWYSWGELLRDLVSGELRDMIDHETLYRGYYGKPPDMETSLQLLGERVRNKLAQLEEWTED